MSRSRRTVLGVVAAAALTAAGTALLVAAPATADSTLRLTTIASGNTDLDLVPGEPGAGDTQVFHDEVRRDGRRVGTSEGACTVTSASETSLAAYCAATVLFDDGSSLTLQGGFEEDPSVGPSEFRWAVTGGTGRYRAAGGEATGTFRPEQVDGFDAVDLEIRLR